MLSPLVEVGTEEGVSVCLEPPGSTCPDSVQIVDATVNTSIHKQCLFSMYLTAITPSFKCILGIVLHHHCPSSIPPKIVLHLVHFLPLPSTNFQALPVPAPFFISYQKQKQNERANFNLRICDLAIGSWLFQSLCIDTQFGKMYKLAKMLALLPPKNPRRQLYSIFRLGKGKEKTKMKRLTHMHTQPRRHSHQLEILRMALFLNAEEAPAPRHPPHFPHQAQMAIQAGDLCPNSTDVLRLEIWVKLP